MFGTIATLRKLLIASDMAFLARATSFATFRVTLPRRTATRPSHCASGVCYEDVDRSSALREFDSAQAAPLVVYGGENETILTEVSC
jgi:hypothetical protein